MIEARLYTASDTQAWNDFVATSRNGFFMFDRGYMDYHADRFVDHSLMIFDDGGLIALLPANHKDGVLSSHQGLTFGGFLTDKSMRAETMLQTFDATIALLRSLDFKKIHYKAIPHIYHRYPAEEDLYALFRKDARLSRVDSSTTIPLAAPYTPNKGKKAGIAKAKKNDVEIRENESLDDYFALLNSRLQERHDTKATHSADEMRLLQSRFPENIRLYSAHLDTKMIAGILVYLSPQVVHTQYIGAREEGLALGANEFLIDHIIKIYTGQKTYFDFGISNERGGTVLNAGLAAQKEHFGGRTIVHQFYEIDL
jgi:hypothetical protein